MQLVAFDLDGTLVDTLPDLSDSLNAALERMGFPALSISRVASILGHGAKEFCLNALPEDRKDCFDNLLHLFLQHYRQNCCSLSIPYPGIPALLSKLKNNGILLAVISNKPDWETVSIIHSLFGSDTFHYISGKKDHMALKPDPAAMQSALNALHVPASKAVFIGDSEVDIEFACRSGMPCISVDWGYRTRDQLISAGGNPIVSNASELESALIANGFFK